ncbi:calcium-binding protein [Aureimonas sp. AU22]|uniref:calcium-binding protein n=1 Tax=Aureimonas sp. AU22 TaxID=1638162 RepID=UPI0007848DE5|nr:calcium-binding protein [Aureimonas sp. AU22]
MLFNKLLTFGRTGLTNSDDVFTSKFYTAASISGLDGNDVFQTPESGGIITSSDFFGGAGDDRLIVNENTTLVFGSKFDGGTGTDTLELTSDRRIVMSSEGNTENPAVTIKSYLGWLPTGSLTGESVERYIIKASAYNDVLVGGAGDDWLDGKGGLDTFQGSAGNDGYVFDTAGERVVGETANGGIDTIWTTVSVDLRDNANVENLRLQGGNIDGTGNELNNVITGSAGNNVIAGGLGNDQLWGKGGADTFAFAEFGTANRDTIFDFSADDKIQLSQSAFAGLTADGGMLAASDFVIGAKATADHAQVIYNRSTGVLSYDADGTGAGAAQDIAVIGKSLAFMDNAHILLA